MRMAYTPENAVLKNYIKYIIIYEPETVPQYLIVFPNPGSAISLYKEHFYYSKEANLYCTKSTPGEDHQMLQVNRIDPVKVIDGEGKELITIVFYPLGINRFLPTVLSEIVDVNGGDPSFIPFKGIAFEDFAKQVFGQKTREGKLKKIESYLLERLRQREFPFVEDALSLLADLDSFYSIPEICRRIGTSPRNLTRLFNKHICLSPVEFRNIYQFRHSMEKKMRAEDVAFKDLVYESNYTHPSYMVRMYKKFTGLNPSTFFGKVAVEANYVYIAL